jgi:flavin reductase (DIM6/NTAB) family NADH-FMN oxidoreductase RutF
MKSPSSRRPGLVTLDTETPIWERFFTVAPLVVIGSREDDGFNFAPKHMVMPLGWENYFGFVCSPRHATYHNAKRAGVFTVTYLRPEHVLLATLAAAPRCDSRGTKPSLEQLASFPAEVVEGSFLSEGYLFLECELDRIIDGFGPNSLVTGRIVGAHVDARALRGSDSDDQQIVYDDPMLVYLYPNRYAEIRRSYSFPLPDKFKR